MADEAQQSHTSNLPKMRTFGRDVARLQRTEPKAANQEEPGKGKKKADTTPMHTPVQTVDPARQAASNSILSNKEDVFDVGSVFKNSHKGSGTIVTDKRRKKRSFLGTIAAAFGERMGDAKQSLAHMEVFQEKVAPTITTPIARKDVIQKAGTGATLAPHDDHKVVVEKLKTLKQDAEEVTGKPFVIKEAPKEAVPSWTHVIEETQEKPTPEPPQSKAREPQLPTPEPTPVQAPAHPKPEQIEPTTPEEIKPVPATVAPQIPLETPEEAVRVPEPALHTPQETLRDATPAPASILPKATPPPSRQSSLEATPPHVETTPSPLAVPTKSIPQTAPAPSGRQWGTLFVRTGLIFVIIIAIGGGIGAGVYLIRTFSPQTSTITTAAPSLVQTDTQIPLPLSANRSELLSSLQDIATQVGPGLTHIYPTTASDAPATAGEILAILALRTPGSFTRSLGEYMTFGVATTQERNPFVILTTNSFDVGFAGMIEWEPYMSADLAPFFGPTITQTFDPSARTSGNIRTAYFVDGIIQNRSVRILHDQFGEEGIVYGFADRNTIIITTSSQAFATILARMQ